MNVLDVARICHEANKGLCESQGDYSQLTWDQAEDWQKSSAKLGVESHLKSDLTPEQSHELWMEVKFKEGWIYGEVKDVNKKTHPCMIPYNQLPKEQQIKDFLFRGIVKTLKPFVGV